MTENLDTYTILTVSASSLYFKKKGDFFLTKKSIARFIGDDSKLKVFYYICYLLTYIRAANMKNDNTLFT